MAGPPPAETAPHPDYTFVYKNECPSTHFVRSHSSLSDEVARPQSRTAGHSILFFKMVEFHKMKRNHE